MLLQDIVKGVNEKLAGEQLPYSKQERFLDEVIDDINAVLNSKFPVFSEVINYYGHKGTEEYSYFPDQYIRNVVIKGAAYKYFIADEEGMSTAEMYGYDYDDALFKMQRDYLEQVPEEYQSDSTGSVVIEGFDDLVETGGVILRYL